MPKNRPSSAPASLSAAASTAAYASDGVPGGAGDLQPRRVPGDRGPSGGQGLPRGGRVPPRRRVLRRLGTVPRILEFLSNLRINRRFGLLIRDSGFLGSLSEFLHIVLFFWYSWQMLVFAIVFLLKF